MEGRNKACGAKNFQGQGIHCQSCRNQFQVFDVVWNCFSDNDLVTVGVKHIKFWRLNGNSLDEKKGVFGNVGSIQSLLCAAFVSQDLCATGAVSGEIYLW